MQRADKGKGKGKGKGTADKGKGKGQCKHKNWQRNALSNRRSTQTQMKAWEKNSGFKTFWTSDWIFDIDGFDIDVNQHSLWLVPLAVPPSTNPVYAQKPGPGLRQPRQILRDLSDSLDRDGIMAIGSLEYSTMDQRDFICAKVELQTGEEGWINVAMHEHGWPSGKWRMYLACALVCKIMRIDASFGDS